MSLNDADLTERTLGSRRYNSAGLPLMRVV